MLEVKKISKKGVVTKDTKYIADEYSGKAAEKKDEIVATVLSESDQMNLLALIVEQIGDSIALNTPEFAYAKVEFAKIKAILAK